MHDKTYLKIVKRLIRRTEKMGDCFVWVGAKDSHGYGWTFYNGRYISVHRLAAQLFRDAPKDSGIFTLHKTTCKSCACWNPECTYEGTQKDNVRDSIRAGTFAGLRRNRSW